MTLKNAKRRLLEIGYDVERNLVGECRYKVRRIGGINWTHHDDLEWLITYCNNRGK